MKNPTGIKLCISHKIATSQGPPLSNYIRIIYSKLIKIAGLFLWPPLPVLCASHVPDPSKILCKVGTHPKPHFPAHCPLKEGLWKTGLIGVWWELQLRTQKHRQLVCAGTAWGKKLSLEFNCSIWCLLNCSPPPAPPPPPKKKQQQTIIFTFAKYKMIISVF